MKPEVEMGDEFVDFMGHILRKLAIECCHHRECDSCRYNSLCFFLVSNEPKKWTES